MPSPASWPRCSRISPNRRWRLKAPSFHLAEQIGGAGIVARKPKQRLAPTGGVSGGGAQKFAQLRRGSRIEPRPRPSRQPRDFPKGLLDRGVAAFLEHEHRHLEQTEFAGF